MQEKMYPELASASAASREPVLESMCGNTMTSDDDRLSFFSSFFPTPALDISQKLAPFAFVKKTSLLLALACVAQLWHNGSRSILTEPMHDFLLIKFSFSKRFILRGEGNCLFLQFAFFRDIISW